MKALARGPSARCVLNGSAAATRPCRAVAGFTLLELMVAIVLAGVVALLVYGAAGAAVDAQARLEQRRLALRSARAWHAIVEDALRNARPAPTRQDTAFVIEDRVDAAGHPADRLSFVTAGSLPPLTDDADWRVVLHSSGGALYLTAAPVGVVDAPPRTVSAPAGISGVDVRVLSVTREPEWIDEWRFPRIVPRAIQLTYWTDEGPLAPVRLTLPLGLVE